MNPVNLATTGIGIISGVGKGVFDGDWKRLENTGKTFIGQFYTDNNRSIFGEILQGISRGTWEAPQSWLGYNY